MIYDRVCVSEFLLVGVGSPLSPRYLRSQPLSTCSAGPQANSVPRIFLNWEVNRGSRKVRRRRMGDIKPEETQFSG